MMKFFRKYTKHLLAVFMALLLIVWLGGDAITSLIRDRGHDRDFVRGTLAGKEIRQKDAAPVLRELEVLNSPILQRTTPWRMIWQSTLPYLGVQDQSTAMYIYGYPMMQAGVGPLNEDDWFLLVLEARDRGIFVSPEAVEQFKEDRGLSGPALQALRQQYAPQLIDAALHSYLMVMQLAIDTCKAPPPSQADIREFVRRTSEKADVTVVTVDVPVQPPDPQTSKFVDSNYQPTNAELAALFDKYKNVASQPAGLDFGYQVPEAVQIEYLEIKAGVLQSAQTISDDAAFDYWQKHKNEFLKPVPPQSAPATQPPPPAPKPEQYPTFTEAKSSVVRALQKKKADEAAQRIAREIIDELGKPWASPVSTQPALESQIPPSEMAPDVYAKALQRWSVKYPGVLTHVGLGLQEAQNLGTDPRIGTTTGMLGGERGMPFARAALLVEGLEPKPNRDSDEARYFRNVYETCSVPFVDQQGNAYVFRAVKIRPKQAPASMDAVRQQLVKDARVKRAYELAGQMAKALKDRAAATNLDAAFKADAELLKYIDEKALAHPAAFSRERCSSAPGMAPYVGPNYVQALGPDNKLLNAIFDLAPPTTTQPSRVLVWEQPEQRRWLVVQLNRILPPTQAEFDSMSGIAKQYLLHHYQSKLLAQWFDAAQIKTRLKWKPADEKAAKGSNAKS
jgi:hypothetical protein